MPTQSLSLGYYLLGSRYTEVWNRELKRFNSVRYNLEKENYMLPLTFTLPYILILEKHSWNSSSSLGLQKSSEMGSTKQSKSILFNHKIQRSPILEGLEVSFSCLESLWLPYKWCTEQRCLFSASLFPLTFNFPYNHTRSVTLFFSEHYCFHCQLTANKTLSPSNTALKPLT